MAQREQVTMAEVRARIERGEYGSGTYEEHMARVAEGMRAFVCACTGFSPERIKKLEFVDVDAAMPGKVAVTLEIDPEVTDAERPAFQRAINAVAALLGSRPPIYPTSA